MVKRKRLKKSEPEADLKPKMGRKSSYEPRFAKIAQVLCGRGATDADLADAFGVSTVTIQNWQSRYPEFGAAIRYGKSEIFDPKVERALAQRALGYTVDTEEVKITKDGDEIRYPIRKHYPPDTTAAIFWLKNRQPEKWRDVWKIEQDNKIKLETSTAAELWAQIQEEALSLGLAPPVLTPVGVSPTSIKPNGTKH